MKNYPTKSLLLCEEYMFLEQHDKQSISEDKVLGSFRSQKYIIKAITFRNENQRNYL